MIRFQRVGRKNDPSFRVVVLEKARSPKAGAPLARVGSYNPKTKAFSVDADGIKNWIANGAQISPSLHNLLVTKGILAGKKINVLPKKTPPVKEQEAGAGTTTPVAQNAEEPEAVAQTAESSEAVPAKEKAETPTA